MNGFQSFRRNMGVNLRSGNIGVSQHDLDDTQVRATFKQMTGKRVAQCLGRTASFFVTVASRL